MLADLQPRQRETNIPPMSEAFAFDTHRFVKNLKANGFTERQAEALADEQVILLNGNLAAKQDIAEIRRDIEALRLETKQAIEGLRLETKEAIEGLHLETKQAIEGLRLETKEAIEALRLETRKGIEGLRLGTKEAIEALRLETKEGIEGLRFRTETGAANLKADLLKWMFGALIAQGGLIVALVRLL